VVWNGHVTTLLAIALFYHRDNVWVWALLGAFAGVYLFYRGFRILQRKRLIMDTPTSKIRSASMGLVEVNGLAVGPYTMIAPVTGVPCYYYRTMAWRWEQHGKSSEWVKVADESQHVAFYLDDNTGKLLVNPQGAEMDIHRDFHEEYSGSFFSSTVDVPLNVATFLSRHAISTDKKLKIEEYCIKPKNSLFILGTLAENHGFEVSANPVESTGLSSFRVKLNLSNTVGLKSNGAAQPSFTHHEVVRLSGSDQPANAADMTQQGKIAAALVKAGITNPAAWSAAGIEGKMVTGASGAAVAPGMAPQDFDPHPPSVLMQGTNNPAFFISWRSQKDVLKSLGWKSAAMIWGGPALTLVCLYLVLAHFDRL
jgi:hypothetical protein